MVHARTGAMSVTPDTPMNLPPHRLPVQLGGTRKDPVWSIGEGELGPNLSYRPDPDLEGHGFVEPPFSMSPEDYVKAFDTARLWGRT